MKEIGNKGTAELLSKKTELDFVAYVISPWHAHSFEAALKCLQEKEKRRLKGIVILKNHSSVNQLINEEFFSDNDLLEFYKYEDDEKIKDRILGEFLGIKYYAQMNDTSKRAFYILRPTGFRYPILAMLHKAFKGNRKITVVELDEGTATYLLNKKEWLGITLKEQNKLKNKLISLVKYFETNLLDENKTRKYKQYIDCCLFHKDKNNICIPNERMPDFFKYAIADYSSRLNIRIPKLPKKYVLVNTQPFEDYSLSNTDTKNTVLKECICIMINEGYNVVVKPHPRENDFSKYEDMGVSILQYHNISQESLLAITDNKPDYIIGYFSTTLVTANVLFNISAISLNNILLATGDVNEKYKTIISNFNHTFSNFVNVVSTIEELQSLL